MEASVIHRCALAIVTKRGHSVIPPSLGTLEGDEEDFLQRHVAKLRSATSPPMLEVVSGLDRTWSRGYRVR